MKRSIKLFFISILLCCFSVKASADQECVVLLHGLARISNSMSELETKLTRSGFYVVNIKYPSRRYEIKILATDAIENRELANTMNLYEREVSFFNEIAQGLDIPIPKCYYAAMDFDSGSDVIVLEDLFEYSLGDQIGGITGEQALMVVDVVAPLHAKYWGKAEETFPKMQRIHTPRTFLSSPHGPPPQTVSSTNLSNSRKRFRTGVLFKT